MGDQTFREIDGIWEIRASAVVRDQTVEQVALYDGDPRNPGSRLLAGPDLRDGFHFAMDVESGDLITIQTTESRP